MIAINHPISIFVNDEAKFLRFAPKINSDIVENYLRDLKFPTNKAEIIHHAEATSVPENVLAFYKYRLPEKTYMRPSDVSFTAFMSAYFFGQD
ncbi:MAG: DUF2795 domain-containing protein [Dehalogenimonas sp.]